MGTIGTYNFKENNKMTSRVLEKPKPGWNVTQGKYKEHKISKLNIRSTSSSNWSFEAKGKIFNK